MNSTSRYPVSYLPAIALGSLGLFALSSVSRAQPPSSATYTVTDPNGQPPPPPPAPALSQPLNQLMAPIALYPDPLIALILPASVFPGEIAAASQYLSRGGDPNAIDNFNWDDSVRALTHYPQILQWMSDNAQWTQDVGNAFGSDPASVMGAIQQLRSVAVSSGTLVSTPQQQVVNDNGQIEIEPASESQIYVPSYDPSVVFVDRPYAPRYGYGGDYISFGDPFVTGAWLGYGFNWEARALWYGDWREWHGGGGHGFRAYHGTPPRDLHAWSPPPGIRGIDRSRAVLSIQHPPTPQPMRGAPPPPNRGRASYPVEQHNQFEQHGRPTQDFHQNQPIHNEARPAEQPQPRPRIEPQQQTRAVEHTNPSGQVRDERAHPERPEMIPRGPEHREPIREQPRAETAHQEIHGEAHPAPQPHAAPPQHVQPQRPPAPAPEEHRDGGPQQH